MKKMKTPTPQIYEYNLSLKSTLGIFGLFFVLFYLVFSPTIFTNYIFHDDTLLFSPAYQAPLSDWMNAVGLAANAREGRPVSVAGFSIFSRIMRDSSNTDLLLKTMRFANLTALSLTASMFAVWLCWQTKRFYLSLIIPLLIFLLPGPQLWIGAASAATHLYSLPLLMGTIWLLGLKEPIFKAWSDFSVKKNLVRIILAILLLNICLFTYQGTVLIFLIPALALLVFGEKIDPEVRKATVVCHLIVYFGASFVYLILYKLILLPYIDTLYPHIMGTNLRGKHFAGSISELWENFKILFQGGYYYRAYSLWYISPNHQPAQLMSLFIGLTVLTFFIGGIIKQIKNGFNHFPTRKFFELFIIFAFVLGGINCVNIALGSPPAYRNVFPYSSIIVILFIWSGLFWIRRFNLKSQEVIQKFFLGGMILIAGFSAQYYSYQYLALQSNREMLFFESQITPFLEGKVKEVIIKRPRHNALVHGDEHSRFTSFGHTYTIHGMLQYLYRKHGINWTMPPGVSVHGKGGNTGGPLRLVNSMAENATSIEIDMNFLLVKFGRGLLPKIKASSVMGNYGPKALLSEVTHVTPILSASSILRPSHGPEELLLASSSIWHAQSPPKYPEWVEIKYSKPVKITKIKVRGQGNKNKPLLFKRGPKNFIFQGSPDGKSWTDLKEVRGAIFFLKSPWLEWGFDNEEAFQYYRLFITANGGDSKYLTIHQLALE